MNQNDVKNDPLDHLAAQAETLAAPTDGQGQGAPGEAGQAEPLGMSNAQAVAGALAAGREAFCFFTKLQSPRAVLSDQRIGELAALAEPVLAKHGIDLGQYLGDYAAELALVLAVVSVSSELRAAALAEIAAKEKTKPEAKPAEPVLDAGTGD